jgi:hypothetical protein
MATPPAPVYRDKFVAFIDVLGFKQLIERSTSGEGEPLSEVLAILKAFGTSNERAVFEKYGPTLCPCSEAIERNLDFRLTQISDCVIVSCEVSPAGVINLLSHCSKVVIGLLLKGVMCRGYVTRGPIFHSDTQIIGTGYQSAYEKEGGVSAFKREADERGTPFVQVDPSIVNYVLSETDECVRTMYGRMVKSDGVVSAIFPFERFSHSFTIGGFGSGDTTFDPEKEHRSNDIVRSTILKLKERVQARVDPNNAKATAKLHHYLSILDQQLEVCNKTGGIIDALCQPFPKRN